MQLKYYSSDTCLSLLGAGQPRPELCALLADMFRVNTLAAIKFAGSGHIGTCFSAMDIVTVLYLVSMNVRKLGKDSPDRDIYFSSKGHDVPGLYALLCAMDILPEERLFTLRRLDGLDGHPDIHIPAVEACTGSLGMGISKARGMAIGKAHQSRGGHVYVMLGDGELQEGQIWESLLKAADLKTDITVIVDHNKVQSDLPVEEVTSLGDLEAKFRAFGASVARVDGHDCAALMEQFASWKSKDGLKVLIADTVKGKGVSFMEEIAGEFSAAGKYKWHSGAPSEEAFLAGAHELIERINATARALGLPEPACAERLLEPPVAAAGPRQVVAEGFGKALVELAPAHPELIVLDGDLSSDCKLRAFQQQYPERFIENGIAEQDMVSSAGGLAAQGMLPVVNSFASFLCARANEQIYNNACEDARIIYAAHFAGMLPAAPGKSHQSVRDIALMATIPGMLIFQPSTPAEASAGLRYLVQSWQGPAVLRMNIGPSAHVFEEVEAPLLGAGKGFVLRPGKEAVLLAYGPAMLNEALLAADLLERQGVTLRVVNMPWLNVHDAAWFGEHVFDCAHVFTLDDHLIEGGMGVRVQALRAGLKSAPGGRVRCFGLKTLPACGTPAEVLSHHGLDSASLARAIYEDLRGESLALDGEEARSKDMLESAH